MKRLLLSLLLTFIFYTSIAQCPANIDFELGNFTNWKCFAGLVDTLNGNNVITLNSSAPLAGRHVIIDSAAALLDSYGLFPQICPYGGKYSVKLGNNDTNNEAEGISYTFQIPPSADTFSLTYHYAVVFEDPGHSYIEQPRFVVTAYDTLTGAIIDCASYNYISNGSIPGFEVSTVDPGVLFKQWTPASIDFSGFAGRMVRLEFRTSDCTRGGHFGYAYLDVGTGCGGVLAVGAYCLSTNSVTLNAPYGFQNYTWYNNNYSTVIGNTRTVNLSPPPPINSLFHVDMVPFPGYGCRDTADAKLTLLPVPDTPVVAVPNIYYCQNDPSTSLQATSSNGNELLWYTTATGGVPSTSAPIPSTTTVGSTNYWVTQKKLFGCESERKKITVTISPTPITSFSINNSRQCQNVNNFIFTSTAVNTIANCTWIWEFGDGATASGPVAIHSYSGPGNFNVKLTVTNPGNCQDQISQQVTVISKPIARYSYPSIICENQTPIALLDNSFVQVGAALINDWWWQIAGNIVTVKDPIPFLSNGGTIPVKFVVTTTEGCKSDTNTASLLVHYSPIPSFSYGPLLCDNETIKLRSLSSMPGGGTDFIQKWNWWNNNVLFSQQQHPSVILALGLHDIKLVAESNQGCKWRFADSLFTINPKPSINLNISDSCVFRNIRYAASDNAAVPVNKWLWDFGNGFAQESAVIIKNYSMEGYKPVTLIGQTANNCKDTVVRPFTIYRNRSKAERDTIAAMNEPVRLYTSADINMQWYKWSPSIGLSSSSIKNPVAIHDKDQVYELNTLTIQGCENKSSILIRRYKGPELYVPTAFTPNGDGANDLLKVFVVGIKSFNYFSIYSRDGQMVFSTHNYSKGWDGTFKGARMDPSNFVWVASAIDYKGNLLFRKGNTLLLR